MFVIFRSKCRNSVTIFVTLATQNRQNDTQNGLAGDLLGQEMSARHKIAPIEGAARRQKRNN